MTLTVLIAALLMVTLGFAIATMFAMVDHLPYYTNRSRWFMRITVASGVVTVAAMIAERML